MVILLIKCDLGFRENSILTKEMLGQMNSEPKWLLLDAVSNIKCGIISGFNFVNEGMDFHSVITKGNIVIDGIWYRLNEDYILRGDNLESGHQYEIILVSNKSGYEFVIAGIGEQTEGIKVARFKYEFSEHKRVFRIPEELADFKHGEAYLKEIDIPYYDYNGICICPNHIANCIKKSLSRISNKTVKQEIIYQNLLNTGNVSVESLCDLVGIKNEELISLSLIEKLANAIGNYRKKEDEQEIEDHKDAESESKLQKVNSSKRSRRMGQRRENT